MRGAREKGVIERVKRVGCERGERETERERKWSVSGKELSVRVWDLCKRGKIEIGAKI